MMDGQNADTNTNVTGLNRQAVRLLSRNARVPLPITEKSQPNNKSLLTTHELDERIKRARLLINKKARQARDQSSVLYRTVSEFQAPHLSDEFRVLKDSQEDEKSTAAKHIPKRARQGTLPRENYAAITKEETRVSHTTGVAMLDVLYRQPGRITTESAMLNLLDQANAQKLIENYLGNNRHVVQQYIEQYATHPSAYEKWSALATEYDEENPSKDKKKNLTEVQPAIEAKPSLIETDILSRCPTIDLVKLQQQQEVAMQTDDSFERFAYDLAANFAELIRVSKFLYFEKSRSENCLVLLQNQDRQHKKYFELDAEGEVEVRGESGKAEETATDAEEAATDQETETSAQPQTYGTSDSPQPSSQQPRRKLQKVKSSPIKIFCEYDTSSSVQNTDDPSRGSSVSPSTIDLVAQAHNLQQYIILHDTSRLVPNSNGAPANQFGFLPVNNKKMRKDFYSSAIVPVGSTHGQVYGVIVYGRERSLPPFNRAACATIHCVMNWIATSFYHRRIERIESQLACELISAAREICGGTASSNWHRVRSPTTLLKRVIDACAELVNASHGMFFVVDAQRKQFVRTFYDERGTLQEKRYPLTKGLAAYSMWLRFGIVVNNPQSHPCFSFDIDQGENAPETLNVITLPLIRKESDEVVGVLQLMNKRNAPTFTAVDLVTLKCMSVYCLVSVYYAQAKKQLVRNESRLRVAQEKLRSHRICKQSERQALMERFQLGVAVPDTFYEYGFHPKWHAALLPELYIQMIHDLFGPNELPYDTLCSFVQTVRNNYRDVQYHNWMHGFAVAHGMFIFIRNNPTVFTHLEKVALMIATVCHDMDHRGFNNAFMKNTKQSLGLLYTKSTMECHHYEKTVAILSDETTNVFKNREETEIRFMMNEINHAIISTDLALYFQHRRVLEQLISDNSFDLKTPHHKMMAKSVLMTMCDVSATAKPWPVQQDVVPDIYAEFYYQGDVERSLGMTPLPMMDRTKKDDMPKEQVGFLKFVCVPCFKILSTLFPQTKEMYDGGQRNLDNWQREWEKELKRREQLELEKLHEQAAILQQKEDEDRQKMSALGRPQAREMQRRTSSFVPGDRPRALSTLSHFNHPMAEKTEEVKDDDMINEVIAQFGHVDDMRASGNGEATTITEGDKSSSSSSPTSSSAESSSGSSSASSSDEEEDRR